MPATPEPASRPTATPVTRAERMQRGLALLRAVVTDPSPAGRECAAEIDGLRARGEHALAAAVRRPVAMPYLAGLDVGARITYEGPPPYEHALEYVDAAAQRFSWDDPRGMYEAADAEPPDPEITAYLAALTDCCRTRGLGTTWAPRMLALATLHATASGDRQDGDRALEALGASAPPPPHLERDAGWAARRLLDPHADAATIAHDLGDGTTPDEIAAALRAFAEACALPGLA